MNIIANNLANVNTGGFKNDRMLFAEHLFQTDDGNRISLVQDIAVYHDFSEGPLKATGNDFDVAIRGAGFFAVETELGPRYTRNGAFTLDDRNQLVTLDGDPVQSDANGPITIPNDAGMVSIARDGTISTQQGEIGRIQVVTFENQQALTKTSRGLFDAGEEEPNAVDRPDVAQGMLESSNVSGVVEMTRMIQTLRNYQSAAKLNEGEHERQRRAYDALIQA